MTLDVSPLRPEDRARWAGLWREYLTFYETTLPEATFDRTWARLMDGAAVHGLAARGPGGIVGITHFLYHPHCWTDGPACYLQDLFVDRPARGQGAGRALIEAVAGHARTQGAERLYWMTQENNAAARALYDRLAAYRGFIKYEFSTLH